MTDGKKGVINWITAQSLASGAADRWRKQYTRYIKHDPTWTTRGERTPAETLRMLEALGPTPTPEQVNAVLGGDGWTKPYACGVCGERRDAVCEIGQQPDYESSTAYVCRPCLTKALAEAPTP